MRSYNFMNGGKQNQDFSLTLGRRHPDKSQAAELIRRIYPQQAAQEFLCSLMRHQLAINLAETVHTAVNVEHALIIQ